MPPEQPVDAMAELEKLESFESLIAGICVNARAASDCREATRITLQTLLDGEFWTAFTEARG